MKRDVGFFQTAIILLIIGMNAQAQPVLVKEISYGSRDFTAVGNFVYYTSDDSLYRTDGTPAGSIFLKNGVHWLTDFTEFKDMVFFVSRSHKELWRSNGSPSGTVVMKISSGFDVEILGITSDYLYFSASESGTGKEIYRTDGSQSGTMIVKDINPGPSPGMGNQARVVGNHLLFSADDGIHGMELWKTNGTSSGTVMVKDINPGAGDGIGESIPVAFNNKLYFSGINISTGAEAWVSDGTVAGTVLLKDLLPGDQYAGFIEYTQHHDGWLYFFSSAKHEFASGETVVDLWKTDGFSASTTKIKSMSRCTSCGTIGDYRLYDDKLYFFLNETGGREVLWMTDGTAEGTMEIFSLMATSAIPFFDEVNGHLLFFGSNDYTATPFYRSDGTVGGTEIFHSFKSSGNESQRNFDDITIAQVADQVYFADHDGPANNGNALDDNDYHQLMQSDGFSTQSIRTLGGGSYIGSGNVTTLGDLILFTTHYAPFRNQLTDSRKRLWTLDPTKPFESRGHLTLVNADADEDIKILNEGDLITKGENTHFNIRFDPPGANPGSVVFKHQGKIVRRENAAPYALAGDNSGDYLVWSNAVPGRHIVEAIPYSEAGGGGTAGPSVAVGFTIRDEVTTCRGSGSILREYWDGVSGNNVSSIPVDTEPDAISQLTSFEGPSNVGTNYGSRIRGYICAPSTGEYIFWIASNDHSELWLSTDDYPNNKRKIAYVTGATTPREWEKFPSQKSGGVFLTAGTRYYIEALHKQGVGTDHVAVGWQLPSGTIERPIPGSRRLSPFSGQLVAQAKITSPTEAQVFMAPADIQISGSLAGFQAGPRVDIYSGSNQLAQVHAGESSFHFLWQDVQPGAYPLKVVATDFAGTTATSEVVNITVEGPCTAVGKIDREYWSGVQGDRVSDIPLNQPPSGSTALSVFETQSIGTNYGARIRGFICPPSTGNYVFWIASNDGSELWISSDDDPANKQRVAYVNGATNFRQWNKFIAQRSAPVSLTQGKNYYIEALHKQGIGTDHLSVGWQLPDGTMERPMQATRLSPYSLEAELESYVTYPANGTVEIDPLVVKLDIRRIVGATRYTVELSRESDFSDAVVTLSSLDDFQSTYIVKDLESASTYYTRVKSDVSDYGPVTMFSAREEIQRLRLWGLTTAGGAEDVGTVFSYSIDDNTFTKHHDQQLYWDGFNYYEQRLMGTLVPGPDGVAYGHADHDYNAKIFTLTPDGNVEWWPDETFFSQAKMLLVSNNFLFVANRPELGPGVIVKYDVKNRDLMSDSRMEFFDNSNNGDDPGAPLIEREDGYLYGTAGSDGKNDGGVVFRFRPDGSGFEVIRYFQEVGLGTNPYSGLTEYNGFLYGATLNGGDGGNNGTIYRIRPDGTEFSKLHDFNGINGSHPESELVIMDDLIYGTTNEGGNSDKGVVFRMNTDGSGFSKLHDFSGTDGARPSRGLVHDRDGNLYGMTSKGGANNSGVIYKLNASADGFTKLFDFTPASGINPNGALLMREDTYAPVPLTATAKVEESMLSVSIHPNPSADNFNVMVSSSGAIPIHMVVTDQYGQAITTYHITADTPMQLGSELKKGIYIVKIIQGKVITMQRMVKK